MGGRRASLAHYFSPQSPTQSTVGYVDSLQRNQGGSTSRDTRGLPHGFFPDPNARTGNVGNCVHPLCPAFNFRRWIQSIYRATKTVGGFSPRLTGPYSFWLGDLDQLMSQGGIRRWHRRPSFSSPRVCVTVGVQFANSLTFKGRVTRDISPSPDNG